MTTIGITAARRGFDPAPGVVVNVLCRIPRAAGNLTEWACVQPPYQGQIERWPART
jgi:hypothetical protein